MKMKMKSDDNWAHWSTWVVELRVVESCSNVGSWQSWSKSWQLSHSRPETVLPEEQAPISLHRPFHRAQICGPRLGRQKVSVLLSWSLAPTARPLSEKKRGPKKRGEKGGEKSSRESGREKVGEKLRV